MEEKDLEITDAKGLEGEEDKTSEKNEEEDKSDKDKSKKTEDDSEDDKEDKKNLSAIAQKKHWREKAQSLEKELAELKVLKEKEKVPDDEAEKKAQQYIDDRIEKILEKKAVLKTREDEKAIEEFNEQIEEVLEENQDITEKEILDVCEQFLKEKVPITPKQAVKFIKLSKQPKKEKPKMPFPNKGSSETKKEEERKPESNFWNVTDKLLKKVRAGEL